MKSLKQILNEIKNQTKTDLSHTDTKMEQGDVAYAYLKKHAPKLHHFIKYSSPIPIDPVETKKMLSQGSEKDILNLFNHHIKMDTEKFYGSDHPALKKTI